MSTLAPEIYLITDTELEGGNKLAGLDGVSEYTSILSIAFCTSNTLLIFIMYCIIYSKAYCKHRG